MQFIHITEKITKSLCDNVMLYDVDTDKFLLSYSSMKNGFIKDQFQELDKHFKTLEYKIILLDERSYEAIVLLNDNSQVHYKLTSSFYDFLDIIMDTLKLKVYLSKSGWERICKKVSLTDFKCKHNKNLVILFDENLDNKEKYLTKQLRPEELEKLLRHIPGMIGTIVNLLSDKVSEVLLWRNDNVFGMRIADNKFICLNCTEDAYKTIEHIFYKE